MEQEEIKPEVVRELEVGPKKWVHEIPTEIFGKEGERKQNFKRLLQELEEERRKQGVFEGEFERRLEKARKFVEDMPLFHTGSLRSVVGIFRSGAILSSFELEKMIPRQRISNLSQRIAFWSNTYKNDRAVGLDKFVFLTTQFRCRSLLGAVLKIDAGVLDRPDVIVTAEDISVIPDRLLYGKTMLSETWTKGPLPPDVFSKVLEEYKRQIISGRDFKEFFSRLIAVYHQNPEEYMSVSFKEEIREYYAHCRRLSPKIWYEPEIKAMKRVEVEKTNPILVASQIEADLLIENGIAKDLIRVGPIGVPEELYKLSL